MFGLSLKSFLILLLNINCLTAKRLNDNKDMSGVANPSYLFNSQIEDRHDSGR